MNSELVSFLLPRLEPLQFGFFVFIVGVTLITALMLLLQANEKNWEKKWQGGKLGSSGLQADHGSIHDLSEAVSTAAEKIAAIMPGMLLVIGLLGTFLGLGMALDHASTILQKSGNASVGAMGGAMQDMTAMMQGLGTKFKTSTWGIMAFILLKVWDLVLRYESRRLTWCITKVKTETSAAEQTLETARVKQETNLHSCITSAAKHMSNAIGEQTATLQRLWQVQVESRSSADAEQRLAFQSGFEILNTSISNLLQSESDAQKIARDSQAVLQEITGVTQRVEQALSTYSQSSDQQLQKGFVQLDTRLSGVADGIERVLHSQSDSLLVHREANDVLGQIAGAGARTELALTEFTDSSRDNLQALQNAGETMGAAAVKVGQSAAELQAVVDSLNDQMTEVMNGVKADLNITLTEMNNGFSENLKSMATQLGSATTQLGNVMEAVKADLGANITKMNKDFGANLENMTASLGQATGNISTAIGSMSSTVGVAMDGVAENMKGAADAQKKTTLEFEQVSENLNVSIVKIQAVVEKLSKDILSGLRAVSESGQRMVSLDKRYDKVSETLIKIPESLDALANAATRPPVDLLPLQQSVDQLTSVANSINKSVTPRKTAKASMPK